jgi:hypothetical protein
MTPSARRPTYPQVLRLTLFIVVVVLVVALTLLYAISVQSNVCVSGVGRHVVLDAGGARTSYSFDLQGGTLDLGLTGFSGVCDSVRVAGGESRHVDTNAFVQYSTDSRELHVLPVPGSTRMRGICVIGTNRTFSCRLTPWGGDTADLLVDLLEEDVRSPGTIRASDSLSLEFLPFGTNACISMPGPDTLVINGRATFLGLGETAALFFVGRDDDLASRSDHALKCELDRAGHSLVVNLSQGDSFNLERDSATETVRRCAARRAKPTSTAEVAMDHGVLQVFSAIRPSPINLQVPTYVLARGDLDFDVNGTGVAIYTLATGNAASVRYRAGTPGSIPGGKARRQYGYELLPRCIESLRDAVLAVTAVLFAFLTAAKFFWDLRKTD